MTRSPFTVFKRNCTDKKTGKPSVKFCARFFDEDGNVVRAKPRRPS